MTRTTFIAAALALAITLPVMPAQAAGVGRTFLSAAGSDSNNCANVLTPCRHLATAYAATAPNGEIYVLDPANYGSVTITGPVSIEGHGWASIAPVTGLPAITINANTGDKINIVGVVLDGTAISGTDGIQFNSGGTLTISDSIIRNFSHEGISFLPNSSNPSQLYVSNTLVSDNGFDAIFINPTGSGTTNGVLNHVEMKNNSIDGLLVETGTQSINVTVSDSVSAGNAMNGIFAQTNNGTPVNIMVRNSTIANNLTGLRTSGSVNASIRATRSTITGNGTGWSIVEGGAITSYADNNIEDNGSANNAPTQIIYK